MTRHIETFRMDWSGIAIEIRYEPNWLNINAGFDAAHLEIESVAPERVPLPFTDLPAIKWRQLKLDKLDEKTRAQLVAKLEHKLSA